MNIETHVEELNQQIKDLTSRLAHTQSHNRLLQTANESLNLRVAGLNSQAMNQTGLHNEVVVENNELKSQVEQLKLTALKYRRRDVHIELLRDLNKTGEQCLQRVNADFLDGYAKEWTGISYDLGDGDVREVANEIRKDAQKMREGE